jgi:O-succinylbenzoic acid--CoA ligase
MNDRSYKQLIINGKPRVEKELVSHGREVITSSGTEDWEKELWTFILQWLSPAKYMEVRTSGSTGSPKTFLALKEKMINSALMTGDFLGLQQKERCLLCLPVDFIAGKMMVVRAFILGLDLTAMKPTGNPLLDIEGTFALAAMTPTQIHNILETGQTRKLEKIDHLLVGGAPLGRRLEDHLARLDNHTYHTYGMTETFTHVAMKRLNGTGKQDRFHAMKGISFSQDHRGCLVIHAPALADLPVVTNDIVKLTGDSSFEFLGRYDEVINSGGIKVHPGHIEDKLSPYLVNRYTISSVPDEKLGEKVILVIEGSKMESGELARLREVFRKVLSKAEIPREIYWMEHFPVKASGKTDRQRITGLTGVSYGSDSTSTATPS